ncbi:AGC family protein kinase [Trichomonas vaginalis G3]|uniref:AGC family protein kinase n=1 Tax=Trichomonas vaginalis (strain ATCC PRA-98 / G3) TaxID=412133 RepID=A2EE66_TRIV3|nr:protein serine/threonine kinase protein [Trichomonas vaginalis G3]EAY09063.1 AGC family protein kinase [Trichomonas vaginalis G3]KAI5503421.1 protein serine/threonine kinase protein [Trichomonas vaginalis G3]|eukprot:XP_001321286.1 AGC family protein kinase [Trichomonas vaginalis G3]
MSRFQRILPPKYLNGYLFEDFLGKGAFSSVYKATNIQTRQKFAIKIFPKSNLKTIKDQERFQHEIDSMSLFKCDYIVKLHGFFWDTNNFYLVLDLCEGGELYDYIIENDKLGEATAALVFKEIAIGISYSHSFGVAHRDIKPQNILITEFPNIKITDFGLCGIIESSQLMNGFCGSPTYCSPECLTRQQYDGRLSDIWSMGVLLYTMVVGSPPWNTTSSANLLDQIFADNIQYPSHISKLCRSLISSMLKINPFERITMDEIMNHPWLKIAHFSPSKNENLNPAQPLFTIPEKPLALLELDRSISCSFKLHSEHGIVPPFGISKSDSASNPNQITITKPNLPCLARNGRPRKKCTSVGPMSIHSHSMLGIPLMTSQLNCLKPK